MPLSELLLDLKLGVVMVLEARGRESLRERRVRAINEQLERNRFEPRFRTSFLVVEESDGDESTIFRIQKRPEQKLC